MPTRRRGFWDSGVYYYPRPPLVPCQNIFCISLGRGLMLSRGKGVWGSTITSASGREPQTPFPRDSINPPIIPMSFCHSWLIPMMDHSVIPDSFQSFQYHSNHSFIIQSLVHSFHIITDSFLLFRCYLYAPLSHTQLVHLYDNILSKWAVNDEMLLEWWNDIRRME